MKKLKGTPFTIEKPKTEPLLTPGEDPLPKEEASILPTDNKLPR